MKVFRLDPIESQRSSHHWRASMLPPTTVWVLAEDEKDARRRVNWATIIATRADPGRELPIAPWKDWGLVSCAPDETRTVPEGVVLTASGEQLEIPN